jgi:DNA-binding CsgD family transcriptional regulator
MTRQSLDRVKLGVASLDRGIAKNLGDPYASVVGADRAYASCAQRLDAMTHSAMGSEELRLEALAQMRATVGFDTWAWPVADPDSLLYAGALSDMAPYVLASLRRYFLLQESGADLNPRSLSALDPRSTAVLSRLTGGDPARSSAWDECLRPHGVGDVMATACRDESGCWGWVVFHRMSGERPFNADEAGFMGGLAPSLGTLARRAYCVAPYADTAPEPPPPGVVIIDESLREAGWTPAARAWLGRLTPVQRLILPGIVGRALGQPEQQATATVRLRTRDGTWAVLDGAMLEGGTERLVAITLRAASSDEVLDILGRAHCLTPRETQIVRHLVNGLTTQQTAERLHIAPFTVKHHLKAIFGKVGVSTRGELVSALTGRSSDVKTPG